MYLKQAQRRFLIEERCFWGKSSRPPLYYPQDTNGILRMPRYPQDASGILRIRYPQDTAVSSGYRVLRIPARVLGYGVPRIPPPILGICRCPQDASRVPGRQLAFSDGW